MEGSGFSQSGGAAGIRLADVGDYRNVDETISTSQAALFTTCLALLSARVGNVGGTSVNGMFDQFGLESVLLVVGVLTILLQFTRFMYSKLYAGFGKPWSPFIFLCIAISIQLIHDALFTYGILPFVPAGKNELLDALRTYAKENKNMVFAGHAILIATTALVAMILHEIGDVEKYVFLTAVLIAMIYALSAVATKPLPPPPPPKKAEPFQDTRPGRGYY